MFRIWDDLGVVQMGETMWSCLYRIIIFDNLTNNNDKGKLVQVIEIDMRDMVDLEEGMFYTLNIIKNKQQKQTQKNRWLGL